MNSKTFYYVEITAENAPADESIIDYVKGLANQFVALSNDEGVQLALNMVFDSTKVHNRVGNRTAMTLEFANERMYNTYKQAVSNFRNWASNNVTWSNEKSVTAAYGALNVGIGDGSTSYYDELKDHMQVTIPTENGFL